VAASALDHYQVQCYLRGGQSTEGGGRDYVFAPGDIGILDMARANRTIVDGTGPRQSAHFLTLFVPRTLLAPLLSAPDGAHGSVVGGATPLGRMLAGQMLALSREAPRLVESERIAAVQAVTGLLAAAVGHAADAMVPVAQAMRDATLTAVKRYIDAMLLSDGLGPDADLPDLRPVARHPLPPLRAGGRHRRRCPGAALE
jgi:AraC family transcriptional regulator, positive regulator of tynA and feaB